MCVVREQVVLKMNGTKYDGNRAMVVENGDMGFFKVQILEMDNFGEILTISKYQVKD